MLAVILALLATLCWGSGDLLAGLSSRRGSVWMVSLASQSVGLVAGAAVIVALGRPWIGWAALLPSLAAGVGVALGMVAYFKALAVGTMSVVAPISGACAVVPVVVGLARGEDPSALQAVGVVAAVLGVVLASYERDHPDTVVGTIEVGVSGEVGGVVADVRPSVAAPRRPRNRLAALLAVTAALLFGFVLVGFSETAKHDPMWPATAARMTSVPLLLAMLVARGVRGGRGLAVLRLPSAVVPATIVAGLLHVAAATLFSAATRSGLLSLLSVLSSLSAVVIVALAHVFLHERLDRLQKIGVTLAIAGVVAIVGG